MILSDAHIQKFGFYAEPINMAEYAKKASKLTLTWLRGKIDRDQRVHERPLKNYRQYDFLS